jgi:MEMO1 family protein
MALFNREPVAAGAFYPNDSIKLREVITDLFVKKPYVKRYGFLNGLIAPHAGYIYSGRTAANAYYELSKHEPRTFVILGPNHTGLGDDLSIMYNANYRTPLGVVNTDANLGRSVCKSMSVSGDFLAHSQEHSIETQIPFLQFLYNNIRILPIVIGNVDLPVLKRLGSLLGQEEVTIIASSDFTHHGSVYHYEELSNPKIGLREHDMNAIELIQKLDVNGFHKLASEGTICGYKPITVLMQAMKERKAKTRFLDYSTSADVTKDYKNVVGYASIVFN